MDKLKPCPFCGGNELTRIINGFDDDDIIGIVCDHCGGGLDDEHDGRVVEKWNTRQPTPDIAAAIRTSAKAMPEPYKPELKGFYREVMENAANIAEQLQQVTLEPVGWCVEDKDGDVAGSVTSEKVAKQYEKQWNKRSHEAEISDSGYPYKAVQYYRVKGE